MWVLFVRAPNGKIQAVLRNMVIRERVARQLQPDLAATEYATLWGWERLVIIVRLIAGHATLQYTAGTGFATKGWANVQIVRKIVPLCQALATMLRNRAATDCASIWVPLLRPVQLALQIVVHAQSSAGMGCVVLVSVAIAPPRVSALIAP